MTNKFIKFESIKRIDQYQNNKYHQEVYVENLDKLCEISEKFDGMNTSFWFNKGEDFQIARRNNILKDDESHSGIRNYVETHPDFQNLLNEIKNRVDNDSHAFYENNTIAIYGEYYGKGIQKRLDYGDKKWKGFHITAFSKVVDERTELPEEEKIFFNNLKEKYPTFFVQPIYDNLTLKEACDLVLKLNEEESGEEREGYVIKVKETELFIKQPLKAFVEKTKSKKLKVVDKEKQESDQKTQHLISEYVTENRLYSLFSKFGEPEDFTQIGQYLNEYKNDVWEALVDDGYKKEDIDPKVFNKCFGKVALWIKEVINNKEEPKQIKKRKSPTR